MFYLLNVIGFFIDLIGFLFCFSCNFNIGVLWIRFLEVFFGFNCDYVFVVIYEFGYLLGFGYEQSRFDRDEYIDILWENVSLGILE